jgi:hypothetical protein
MDVCLLSVVCLSGRGLCDGLITRAEESYRLWCALVCDNVTSGMRRLKLARVVNARQKKKNIPFCFLILILFTPCIVFQVNKAQPYTNHVHIFLSDSSKSFRLSNKDIFREHLLFVLSRHFSTQHCSIVGLSYRLNPVSYHY